MKKFYVTALIMAMMSLGASAHNFATQATESHNMAAAAAVNWAVENIGNIAGNVSVTADDEAELTWTSLGDATLMDGWLCPTFGIDQHDSANWWKVELQQCNENENLYRLVDPYGENSAVHQYNEGDGKGYIVFDVTDPDHVVFRLSDAGFVNASTNLQAFYPMNVLTAVSAMFDMDPAAMVQMMGEILAPYTTFKDGVVYLATMQEEDGVRSDAVFGDQGSPYAGVNWLNDEGEPIDMETRIMFPKEDGIAAVESDSQAPVRYYNLQGIEISIPVPGTVVIARRGTQVNKMLVK